jgi:hypothetical protein
MFVETIVTTGLLYRRRHLDALLTPPPLLPPACIVSHAWIRVSLFKHGIGFILISFISDIFAITNRNVLGQKYPFCTFSCVLKKNWKFRAMLLTMTLCKHWIQVWQVMDFKNQHYVGWVNFALKVSNIICKNNYQEKCVTFLKSVSILYDLSISKGRKLVNRKWWWLSGRCRIGPSSNTGSVRPKTLK